MFIAPSGGITKTTTPDAVLPFYVYAALSFLTASVMLLLSAKDGLGHYFHPVILAITHIMALGWGTLMIIGVSHQLIPVIAESALYSVRLAKWTFVLAAIGIPLLIDGFYRFNFGWLAISGAVLIILALLLYFVNLAGTFIKKGKWNVQVIFVFTAICWLMLTVAVGFLLLINFNLNYLDRGSVYYLSFHAHLGIVGWFLLLIFGVGSRLIPMFMISKYNNVKLLWGVYVLVNALLLMFCCDALIPEISIDPLLFQIGGLCAAMMFGYFIVMAFRQRIRKKVDSPMQMSLLSVVALILPPVVLILNFLSGAGAAEPRFVMIYGFIIFFGWISSIIFGMTFKTLPFIVWNRVYHKMAGSGKAPAPKDLYNGRILIIMNLIYIAGFMGFAAGLMTESLAVMKGSAFLLVATGLLYNFNVIKILIHKPRIK